MTRGESGIRADLRRTNLYRANLQYANLKMADLQGANLDRADLRCASLEEANLQGAYLWKAQLQGSKAMDVDLQGANLLGANLRGADFRNAKLHGASLLGANLQGVHLQGASLEQRPLNEAGWAGEDLPGADLTHANLRNAHLNDAQLSTAIGLQEGQLAGANLSNAKLPPQIAAFDSLTHVADVSRHARTIFLVVVIGCAYAWLTIAATTDLALIVNAASTPLPILQTEIPIASFFWAAPVILLALFCYLHFYLQNLWEALVRLPAVFPDGRTLDQKVYPWSLASLARAHIPMLAADRPALSKLKVLLSITLAWLLVPVTIFALWIRYLPRHDWAGTAVLIFCLLAAVWAAIAFYRRARATLRRTSLRVVARNPSPEALSAFALALALTAVSDSAYSGPDRMHLLGYGLHAKLAFGDVSTKPMTWTGLVESSGKTLQDEPALLERAKAEVAQVKGATMPGANLRHADGFNAFLVRADLSRADLREANLSEANLREADLSAANLRGGTLFQTNLRDASLGSADLRGAFLGSADLQGARLLEADLRGAKLLITNLESANLWRADLQDADLPVAKLKQAYLREANLTGANLENADLQGADLQDAVLEQTVLTGASLLDAKGLTQGQLDGACGDAETELPPGLVIRPCVIDQEALR